MTKRELEEILDKILSIKEGNAFLNYIVRRLRDINYRGWHVSQHNRYDMEDISIIVRAIHANAGEGCFAIPPGDFGRDAALPKNFRKYQKMVNQINSEMGRGTINSLKKNFFPDLDRMGFLLREVKTRNGGKDRFLYGKLTPSAVEFINAATVIDSYKKFTDGIDRLFGNRISELAEMIYLSDYANDLITIHEFMFILSDNNQDVDKIMLLGEYRKLKVHQQSKVIDLIKEYATPENFNGNKTMLRDFHNWKNQAQQIIGLLKTTVYFEVDADRSFRLNVGNTGFFQGATTRSGTPKREYFAFHKVGKKADFDLHHIVPIASARNKKQAKEIDDYRNLVYVARRKHRAISKNGNKKVVLDINPAEAVFSDIENSERIKAKNDTDALYTKEQAKISTVARYNAKLLRSIFEFEGDERLKPKSGA